MHCYACPLRTWEIAVAQPGPRLRRIVHAYRGFRLDDQQPGRWLGVPSGAVTLLFGFDHERALWFTAPADRAAERPYVSMLTGLSTRSWLCAHRGSTYGIEAVLAPWAAFTLCGVAMHDLAGIIIEPDELLGDRLHQLTGALAALPGWRQRFALLDEVLPQWLGRGHPWSPRVEWAYEALRRSCGRIPVRRLADDVGWTSRQLEYRFREQIGLPPKAAARVLRLYRAVRRLAAGWLPADVAAVGGFSDQAHLTREVRAMTGLTPGHLRAPSRLLGAVATSERAIGQLRSIPLAPETLLVSRE
ncbi:helix-turn-helix domain-containing protein [Nonomuraea basaltis]|uniref:helix-turn-helix domain-containing protein n=1 Tax=Nonomuraea basaltis TaxID=2495887 RepID=UPI001980521D|nr:AraC family transcriptional regulator [Nonomuraea basaltis]TMR94020.1 helix-turn-helix transcriptional regulator [Nonomuraea basaltis]